MEPVVIIQDGARRDEPVLRWAAAYAQLVGTGLEIHRPQDDFRAQLVVVGYRGPGNSALGLGGHVLPLLAATRCDTVVVRGTPAAVDARHRHVTALVSGGPGDGRVLRHAAGFARRRNAALRVLHAAPEPPAGCGVDTDHTYVLARAAAALGGIRHHAVLVRAQPHEAIARCTDTDLIVVGSGDTHESGTVTRAALLHAPCPVLVVHQPVLEANHGHITIPAPRRPVRLET
ncbi:universal stress protein [Lentzea flaviverrucosa]|uniref:Universal stress protein family protein n=1 Tax=Lentzea flaviverrucosa TaxID=200379 RepID=A0A1H9XWM8_9PSEU|nr:universal stress protein [Lentzea flaviverrucosa]RDI34350.1 universal stress protein family protein [Lentzea flaviverrucosa]SES50479.1 Universal stress protein family protein [Lentzea flaviverrucosa]